MSPDSQREIMRLWDTTMTDPRYHNENKFRYVIHGIDPPDEFVSHYLKMVKREELSPDPKDSLNAFDLFFNPQQLQMDTWDKIDLLNNPGEISDKRNLSLSLIDSNFTKTWGSAGFIIKVPADNILRTSYGFSERKPWRTREELDQLYAERSLLSPNDMLENHLSRLNEIIAVGTGRKGSKVKIQAVFIKVYADPSTGKRKLFDPKLAQKIKSLAKKNNWPVIEIEDKRTELQEIPPKVVGEYLIYAREGSVFEFDVKNNFFVSRNKEGKLLYFLTPSQRDREVEFIRDYLATNPSSEIQKYWEHIQSVDPRILTHVIEKREEFRKRREQFLSDQKAASMLKSGPDSMGRGIKIDLGEKKAFIIKPGTKREIILQQESGEKRQRIRFERDELGGLSYDDLPIPFMFAWNLPPGAKAQIYNPQGISIVILEGINNQVVYITNLSKKPIIMKDAAMAGGEKDKAMNSDLEWRDAIRESLKKNPAVLLIEDDEQVRNRMRGILETAKINVFAAANYVDGMTFFEENKEKIGLVITDNLMPHNKGEEKKSAWGETIRGVIFYKYEGPPVIWQSQDFKEDAVDEKGLIWSKENLYRNLEVLLGLDLAMSSNQRAMAGGNDAAMTKRPMKTNKAGTGKIKLILNLRENIEIFINREMAEYPSKDELINKLLSKRIITIGHYLSLKMRNNSKYLYFNKQDFQALEGTLNKYGWYCWIADSKWHDKPEKGGKDDAMVDTTAKSGIDLERSVLDKVRETAPDVELLTLRLLNFDYQALEKSLANLNTQLSISNKPLVIKLDLINLGKIRENIERRNLSEDNPEYTILVSEFYNNFVNFLKQISVSCASFYSQEKNSGGFSYILSESLKNAFVHGNKFNFNVPIYLYFNPDQNTMMVFDGDIKEKPADTVYEKDYKITIYLLHGEGRGIRSSFIYDKLVERYKAGNAVVMVLKNGMFKNSTPMSDNSDETMAGKDAAMKTVDKVLDDPELKLSSANRVFLKTIHGLIIVGNNGIRYKFLYNQNFKKTKLGLSADTFDIARLDQKGDIFKNIGSIEIFPSEGSEYIGNDKKPHITIKDVYLIFNDTNKNVFSGFLNILPEGTELKLEHIIELETLRHIINGILKNQSLSQFFEKQDIVEIRQLLAGLDRWSGESMDEAVDVLYKYRLHENKEGLQTLDEIFQDSLFWKSLRRGGFHNPRIIFEPSPGEKDIGMHLIAIKDKAMAGRKGGIDLTSDKALTVQNNGQGIKFHIDPAQLEQLQNAPGFVPVIINIQPMTDIRTFLGLNQPQASTQSVSLT